MSHGKQQHGTTTSVSNSSSSWLRPTGTIFCTRRSNKQRRPGLRKTEKKQKVKLFSDKQLQISTHKKIIVLKTCHKFNFAPVFCQNGDFKSQICVFKILDNKNLFLTNWNLGMEHYYDAIANRLKRQHSSLYAHMYAAVRLVSRPILTISIFWFDCKLIFYQGFLRFTLYSRCCVYSFYVIVFCMYFVRIFPFYLLALNVTSSWSFYGSGNCKRSLCLVVPFVPTVITVIPWRTLGLL